MTRFVEYKSCNRGLSRCSKISLCAIHRNPGRQANNAVAEIWKICLTGARNEGCRDVVARITRVETRDE